MIIKSLKLKNFRNYENLEMMFHPGTNLFYGDNAQGKTNILEAIYLCGTTKSHKGSKDKEMIYFEEEESHLSMDLVRNTISYQVDMHLKRNRSKGIAINHLPIRKAGELFEITNFVFFSPEDLNIIKNGPSERRRFIDMELCQLSKIYLSELGNYNKIVLQRNKLLKEISFHPEFIDMLDVWDEQMSISGIRIIREREQFIQRLNEIIFDIHKNLSGGREHLILSYEKNVTQEEFQKVLQKNRERDLKMKMSMTGPHRDDICFKIGAVDIRKYGSQGQQRTAALSLKLSEIELAKKETKDTPVLLLDDVLSELDRNRQHYLLECIHDIQTFITCTGVDDFIENEFKIDRVFHVIEGKVYE